MQYFIVYFILYVFTVCGLNKKKAPSCVRNSYNIDVGIKKQQKKTRLCKKYFYTKYFRWGHGLAFMR